MSKIEIKHSGDFFGKIDWKSYTGINRLIDIEEYSSDIENEVTAVVKGIMGNFYVAIDIRDILKYTWDLRRNLCNEDQLKRILNIFKILLKSKKAVKCLSDTVFSIKDSRKPPSHIPLDTEVDGVHQKYTLLCAAVCENDFELANLIIDSVAKQVFNSEFNLIDLIDSEPIFNDFEGILKFKSDIRDILKFTWDVRRNLCEESELKCNLSIFRRLLKIEEAVKCLSNTVFSFKDSIKPFSDIPLDTEMAGVHQKYTLLYAAVCENDFKLANLMINSGVDPNFVSYEIFYSSNGKHIEYRLPLEAANYFKSIGNNSTEVDKLIINLIKHGARVIN